MKRAITIDLDDTLMQTQEDYEEAKSEFAEWANREFGIDPEKAIETEMSIDRDLFSEYGLSLERFPRSMELTIEKLASDVTEEQKEKARSIGRTAYKTRDEYQQKGFIDGAEEMIRTANEVADHTALLTAGVMKLQRKKVDALGLNKLLDEIIIVGQDGKTDVLSSLNETYTGVTHIGNSVTSDVESAEEANTDCIHVTNGDWMGNRDVPEFSDNELFTVSNLNETRIILGTNYGGWRVD